MARMTKKRRSAIARKASRTRAMNAKKAPVRRRKAKKKGALADITGIEGKNAVKDAVSGAVGGMLYAFNKKNWNITDETPEKKALFGGAMSFGTAVFLKKPKVAAGIAGAAAAQFATEKGLFKKNGSMSDPRKTQMSRTNFANPLVNKPLMMNDGAGRFSLSDAGAFSLSQSGQAFNAWAGPSTFNYH